jgi:hypothetical protein
MGEGELAFLRFQQSNASTFLSNTGDFTSLEVITGTGSCRSLPPSAVPAKVATPTDGANAGVARFYALTKSQTSARRVVTFRVGAWARASEWRI